MRQSVHLVKPFRVYSWREGLTQWRAQWNPLKSTMKLIWLPPGIPRKGRRILLERSGIRSAMRCIWGMPFEAGVRLYFKQESIPVGCVLPAFVVLGEEVCSQEVWSGGGGMVPGAVWHYPSPPWTDTHVKTLPSRNFVVGGNNLRLTGQKDQLCIGVKFK